MPFKPVQYKEVHNFINRAYNECQALQWARETLKNSLEAESTRVHFGVEYQAVEKFGVYRRLIVDNGKGMTKKQLYDYFSYAGTGAKKIGGEHDNFGIGAKISLMPWNPYGLVIISWVNAVPQMIWIEKDQKTGQYGLRSFEQFDDENVVAPFVDPEHGCDWSKVKPEFIGDHGTVIVLLGSSALGDTVLGDPHRPGEGGASLSLIHYLNQRFWTLPAGAEVSVNRFMSDTNKDKWPKNALEGRSPTEEAAGRKGANINLYGGRAHVTQERRKAKAEISSGTVSLQDQTQAHWFLLRKGGMPDFVQGPGTSFIGVLYSDELYNVNSHHVPYRTMGVTPQSVRTRLWVIFEPPIDNPPHRSGVYPESARSALKHSGTPDRLVPVNDWLIDFAKHMPEEIRRALAEAFGEAPDYSTLTSKLMERLAQYLQLWGKKFKQRKLITFVDGGPESVDITNSTENGIGRIANVEPAVQPGDGSVSAHVAESDDHRRPLAEGADQKNAKPRTLPRDQPKVRWRPKTDFEDQENHFVMWVEIQNLILLNEEHQMLTAQVERWQSRFGEHVAEEVARKVREVYEASALSVFLSTEGLSLGKELRDEKYRSPEALTVALMGYFREDEILRQQLAYLGKAKAAESAA